MINELTGETLSPLLQMECFRTSQLIGNTLQQTYPGYRWRVKVDVVGGVATINIPAVTMDKCMTVHLDKIAFDMEDKIKLFGGEFLERYGLKTATIKDGEIEALRRDLKGNAVGGQ